MQPRKKLRLGAPDGFEKSLAQSKPKIAVPQFASAFASSSTAAPKPPPPKITASLDPQLKDAFSGDHAKSSLLHNNGSVPSILAPPRLAVRPDLATVNNRPNPFVAFKDLSAHHDDRLRVTPLQQQQQYSTLSAYAVDELLIHRPRGIPDIALNRLSKGLLFKENEDEQEEALKKKKKRPIGSPPRLPVSGDTRHPQTLSTTSIACVTDISTDSGNAELASIFLYDQHPEIVQGEGEGEGEGGGGGEARRGLNFSPRKGRYGNSDPPFVRGGLASRASKLITRMHTSLALWQKEAERHALPATPDLCMTIVKIEHVPVVPSSTAKSSSCFGIALCRIISRQADNDNDSSSTFTSRFGKTLSKVVFSFSLPPAPQDGPPRSPSSFAANAEVYAWKPWHEVKLTPAWPLASVDAGKKDAARKEDAPMPASFPMSLTSAGSCSPGSVAGSDDLLPLSDTALLCDRFVFVCQNAPRE